MTQQWASSSVVSCLAISRMRSAASSWLETAMAVLTSVSSSRSRASRAAKWLRPPMRWLSSSMSSCLMRRWPPAVRVHGRKPDEVQRRMVCGDTPSRRAASWTLRYMPLNLSKKLSRVN